VPGGGGTGEEPGWFRQKGSLNGLFAIGENGNEKKKRERWVVNSVRRESVGAPIEAREDTSDL